MDGLKFFFGAAVAVYLLICVGMYLGQRALLYPGAYGHSAYAEPTPVGFSTVELSFGPDLSLTHLFRPPTNPEAPVIVGFHGNAGTATAMVNKLSFLAQEGFGVFAMEYRGFAGQPGKPTEERLKQDAEQVIAWLNASGWPPEKVVLYGESLGTGLATAMGARHPVKAVILEAPFTSIVEVASYQYPWLPTRWLVKDTWHSDLVIEDIESPVLIMHGGTDGTIPVAHGKQLLDLVAGQSAGFFPDGARHMELYLYGAQQVVREFLAER